jgi:hypothetical protein
VASGPVVAEPNAWNDWVRDNSPHGVEVTKDGTIWINLYKTGSRDDYAVRAGDLRNAREAGDQYPKYWIRTYHLKNKDIKYRETKGFFQLDCKGERIRRILGVGYDALGTVLSQWGEETSYSIIIPGTLGAEQHRLFCLVPR